jgi:hypothetical protein
MASFFVPKQDDKSSGKDEEDISGPWRSDINRQNMFGKAVIKSK